MGRPRSYTIPKEKVKIKVLSEAWANIFIMKKDKELMELLKRA